MSVYIMYIIIIIIFNIISFYFKYFHYFYYDLYYSYLFTTRLNPTNNYTIREDKEDGQLGSILSID